MNTIISRSALAIATVFATATMRAAEPVAPKTITNPAIMERELQHQIDKHISYPLMSGDRMDGAVLVSFVIDTEGRVKVIAAESDNTALREYVVAKLAKVDIGDNPDGLWKTTHMRFIFRPEA